MTLTIGDKGLATIKHFEGCKLEAYPDPGSGGDPWTIGYGATGEGIHHGVRWTQQQCDDRLGADVATFARGVARLIGNSATTQGEFDALTCFAYNVGLLALQRSTLLRKHLSGDKSGAAAEFGKWNKAAGRVMRGLTMRRAAEAALYRGAA